MVGYRGNTLANSIGLAAKVELILTWLHRRETLLHRQKIGAAVADGNHQYMP
jgi:hypothetical protein